MIYKSLISIQWSCLYSFLLLLVYWSFGWKLDRKGKDATIFGSETIYKKGIILKGKLKWKSFFFFFNRHHQWPRTCRVFWEHLQLESLEMWVTDQSLLFAGHCDFEASLLQISIFSSVEWDDWSGLIYKILSCSNCLSLSWGAGGQMSFSSELLPPSGAPLQPSPPPPLFRKLPRMS